MSVPDLVIPVRMDTTGAVQDLKRVGLAGTAAGDDVAKGMQHGQAGAHGLSNELAGLYKAKMAMDAVLGVATAIGERLKWASDNAAATAKQFIEIQKGMQSIAALSGKANSNQFTSQEVSKARAANLTPQEWTGFRDEFLSKASNYVGNKPGAILDEKESEKFQASMAEYAKLHGVGANEMAGFAGGLLAQEKGPTTAEAMQAKAGKVFATLEASSKKVSGLLPGMTEQMAMGMTAEEAAPKLAAMPEIAPGQESAYLKGTISHLMKARGEGKLEQFGVTDEMGANQMLEQVVKSLNEQAGEGPLRGKKMQGLLHGITDYQETQQTLTGLANKGPAGDAMWKAIGANTPADAIQKDILAGRQTDAGRQMRIEADQAAATAERGAKNVEVERIKQEARAQLTREGRFEASDVGTVAGDMGRKAIGRITGNSLEETLVNERAVKIAKERMGIGPGEAPVGAQVSGMESSAVVDAGLRTMLEGGKDKLGATVPPGPRDQAAAAPRDNASAETNALLRQIADLQKQLLAAQGKAVPPKPEALVIPSPKSVR